MNMGIIIAFVILGVIIVGIVSGGVAIYNRLVMLKYNVDKNFANIDVILKQRVDEIPNLIAVVKKTQGYEESLLNQLTELRTAFLSSRSTEARLKPMKVRFLQNRAARKRCWVRLNSRKITLTI